MKKPLLPSATVVLFGEIGLTNKWSRRLSSFITFANFDRVTLKVLNNRIFLLRILATNFALMKS